jgi:hypothetical protein
MTEKEKLEKEAEDLRKQNENIRKMNRRKITELEAKIEIQVQNELKDNERYLKIRRGCNPS